MDFNRPNISNATDEDIDDQREGRTAQAVGFDPALVSAPSNPPEGMIRWNSALKKFQKLVSAAWVDLTDVFDISISGNAGGLNGTGTVAVLQAVYPIGSLYFNASVNTNPATLLGFGTWETYGAGRMLISRDASDALFDTVGETGGSKDSVVVGHSHTATSTVTDPGHTHPVNDDSGSTNGPAWESTSGTDNPRPSNPATTGITVATTVSSTGVSGTNANLPPFIAVNVWRRIA